MMVYGWMMKVQKVKKVKKVQKSTEITESPDGTGKTKSKESIWGWDIWWDILMRNFVETFW